MRILTISNCALVESQGSGYVIQNYVCGLRQLGHEVDVLQPKDYEMCQMMSPRGNSLRQALGMRWRGLQKLSRKDYDIVEFYGGEAWLAMRRLAKHHQRRPFVVQHTNGPEPRYEQMMDTFFGATRRKWYQLSQQKFMRDAFLLPDLVVTVSEFDRDWLIAEACQPSERVVSIENPIADVFFEMHSSPPKEKLIGYCGTWLPKKGTQVLCEDLSRILVEFPEYCILLIGVGESFDRSKHFQEGLCNRIEIIPYVGSKVKLRILYDRMSIFAFPSVIESFGLALAEAMACGCAPVTTRVGLGASLVDGKQALLLEKPESPYLYESVKRLILNPELCQQIGVAARERVQFLRWDSAVRTLSDTYEYWRDDYRRAV